MMHIQNRVFVHRGLQINYRIYTPEEAKGRPLLVYLHGAGERGDTPDVLSHIERHAVPKLIAEGVEIPAVVLCPQCPTAFVWDNLPDVLYALILSVTEEYATPRGRILLTGSSMGGYGTWMLGMTYPTLFAGIAPISGGAMSWRASNLVKTPVLAIHGRCDTLVPPACSEMPINALKAQSGDATLVLLDGAGHNDGIDYAYRHAGVIEWLLAHERTDFSPVPEFCSECF